MNAADSFRPTARTWAAWMGLPGIPVLIMLFDIAKFGWSGSLERNLEWGLLLALSVPVWAAIWLSRFRLEFAAGQLTYRSWAGGTRTVALSRITDVTASRTLPIGAYVQLDDGSRLLVNLKVFPRAAATRLFALRKASNNRWRGP